MSHFKRAGGFTLIEVMITLFVLTLAICGYIGANVTIQRYSEEMHERTVAVQEANRIIERMRNAAQSGTFPGNVTAAFPSGAVAGVNALTGETATVSYANTAADPLDVTVTVTWQSYARRTSSTALRTYITQR